MNVRFKLSVFGFVAITAVALPSMATDYQLQTLEKAHGLFRSATNVTMFTEAAQQYEYLVNEEGIRNGNLFYTLGNSWFMAGDIGRAILNYRRAERYLPTDADIQHNLNAALEMRADLIPEKELHPFSARLLGWHFNISTSARWTGFALCWLVLWGSWIWMTRSPKKEARIATMLAGILSAVLLTSLLTESILARRSGPGVLTAKEVLARKGDSTMYAPAFLEPLHSGTEFQRLEDRGTWWHIRLADGQTCWIPSVAAEMVALPGE